MPAYDFSCEHCGEFNVWRSIATRNEPCACPQCGSAATRLIGAPALAVMSASARLAHSTNERARHAPRHSAGHVHGPACGCGKGPSARGAEGAKSFPSKRPWMISH